MFTVVPSTQDREPLTTGSTSEDLISEVFQPFRAQEKAKIPPFSLEKRLVISIIGYSGQFIRFRVVFAISWQVCDELPDQARPPAAVSRLPVQ